MTPATVRAGAGSESARERILRAAARLYALQGFEGTTIRQIALAAGVTKPLVHYHFGSKEQLFSSLLRESIDEFRAVAAGVLASESSAPDRLRDLLRAQFARARAAPEVVAFAYEVLTQPGMLPLGFDYKSAGRALFQLWVQLVEDGQERGEFRHLDADAVVVAAIATVAMYVAAVLSGELDEIPPGVEDTVFDLLVHGLGVPGTAPRPRAQVARAGRGEVGA